MSNRMGVVVGLACALALLSCKGGMAGQGDAVGQAQASGGGEMSAQCSGDFGASASAQKLEAFLSASGDFIASAGELEGSLLAACQDMGKELQVSEADIQAQGNVPPVKATCAAVAAKLKAELTDLRAQAKLEVAISAQPPRCEVAMDAYASCAAECDANVQPGQLDVKCEGGEVVGSCKGECKGQCSAEVQGQCKGSCEGTCEGGCKGECHGSCEGKCSAKNAQGECEGKCDGTCHGTCSAKCKGSCEGECWAEAKGECTGSCKGECSVAFEAPRCTGNVKPPSIDAQCEASCDAKLQAKAQCEPGHVQVDVKGKASADIEPRLARVRAAIEGGWGAVMLARAKLERVGASAQGMVKLGAEVPKAVGNLGISAAGCAAQAAGGILKASASVSVSVEASASIGGAASAG